MAVVPIKSGEVVIKPPKLDQDLIEHLKVLLAAAERGEVQAYLAGYVLEESADYWFTSEPEWIPDLSFTARKGLALLESDDD